MHNIFLGTGKHIMKIWFDKNIITKKHCLEIEKIVTKIKTARHTGRLPLKISTVFRLYGGPVEKLDLN